MVNGCRGDDEVRLGKCVASFPAFLNQHSPLEHDVLADRKNPLLEHRTELVCEPFIQLGAAIWFTDQLMPNRISAKVTTLIWSCSSSWVVTNATTLGSGFGRRSSDKMLVSSSHAIKT